jgi:hypothetical protein
MGAAVITDSGLKLRLAATLNRRLFLRLFRNDVPILVGSTLIEFQASTWPGYADLELTGLWSSPVIDTVGRAWSAVYNQIWTRGAGGLGEFVYGWIVYELPDPDSVLVCGKRLTTPRWMDTMGQTIIESIIVYLLRG